MSALSTADHSVTPPALHVPREFNAAHDLLERNLRAGRADKIAYIDDRGVCTYGELAERVNRCANALRGLGLQVEQRVLICMHDSIDWPTVFLGAIKAGIVPIAVNTLLTTADYRHMLQDSRARALIVSADLLPAFQPLIDELPLLEHVIVTGSGAHSLADLLSEAGTSFEEAPTTADDMCFWLYSSGSTGAPKGTIHVHSSLIQTAELYGRAVLGLNENDIVFSAPKLFFAYGLGNALSFPLSVGATTVLMGERPTPDKVFDRIAAHRPTVFFGVPTLYTAMLASDRLPECDPSSVRTCVSAGEPLPEEIGRRWVRRFGIDILDGIGSTEMLHIFLSNRPGDVHYGTTGQAVPGYRLRIVDDLGIDVPPGQIGELQVCGPTCALAYWNNRERSRATFLGDWVRTGDKYSVDEQGRYVYAGRSDDMLKVSGMYVSPVEVESALITHDSVLEAAVIGRPDADGLVKPLACVVLKQGHAPGPEIARTLQQHVKTRLAPFKYPRWIEFVAELPKTATGKIQRFKLRQQFQ
ncbi:MAG TPA: benzoate-CoA ligase family protein [Steroidobacteraceae bacterium]